MIGAYRGVGWTSGHTAGRCLIDDDRRELGIDPVELRVMNMIPSEPYESATGLHTTAAATSSRCARRRSSSGTTEFRTRQRDAARGGPLHRHRLQPLRRADRLGARIAQANGLPVGFFDTPTVTIEPDGSVIVTTGLQSHGQGHETSLAQVAADQLGVRLEDVRIIQGDTGAPSTAWAPTPSRSAVVGGGAIIRAGATSSEKLVALAGPRARGQPGGHRAVRRQAPVKGVPGKAMSMAEIAGFAYFGGRRRPADVEPALTSTAPTTRRRTTPTARASRSSRSTPRPAW